MINWVMGSMEKLDLSYAYYFVSSVIILMFFLPVLLYQEPVTVHNVLGLIFIVSGTIVTSRSA